MSVGATQGLSWAIEPFLATIGGSQTLAWGLGTSNDTTTLILTGSPSGLVGVITIRITTNPGGDIIYGPTTSGIEEIPTGTGRYVATVPTPPVGRYFVVWSNGVTTTDPVDLTVLSDALANAPLHAITAAPYELKTGDLQPPLIAVLTNADGTPIDLTLADNVTVYVRYHTGDLLLARDAFVLDAEGGEVMLDWMDGEQDTPGIFDAEWQIHWPNDLVATVPSRGFYRFTRYDTLTVMPSNRWTLN